MPVHIKISTTLRRYVPDYNPYEGFTRVIDQPITAEALAISIGLPLEEIKVVMINGEQARMSYQVHPDDRVAYFPAVGGG